MTDRVVTKAEWDALAEWMDTIEAAILTLKASALSYKGTWSGSAVTYRKGDAVTRDGALWVCGAKETNARPGADSGDWQMATKSR